MLQEGTEKKPKGMLVILAICFSFLLQIAFFQTDYGKIASNKSCLDASIQDLKDITQQGDTYTLNASNAAIFLEPPSEEITGVLFHFIGNRKENINYAFSFGQNSIEPDARESEFDFLQLDAETLFLPLDKDVYTTLKLELIFAPDAELQIPKIHFIQEEITIFDQLLSRISLTNFLFSLIFLGILTLLFNKFPDKAKIYLPYLVVSITLGIMFANTTPKGDDVLMFYGLIVNNSPLDLAIMRYNTWSSRQVIEFFLYYLVHYQWLWAMATVFLLMLFFWSVTQVLPKTTTKTHLFFITVFLIYPLSEHSSAGWIATTTNYLWPICFLSFSLVLLKKLFSNEKITPLFYVLSLCSGLYAVNQEQSAALYFGSFSLAVAYGFWKKIKVTSLYPQVCLGLFSLVYHLTCPGNKVRGVQHEYKYFPGFYEFTTFQKFDIGLSSALFNFLFSYNTMLFTLCTLLLAVAYAKKDKKIYITAGIPVAVFTLNNIPVVQDLMPLISTTRKCMSNTGLNLSFSDPKTILALFVLLITFTSLLLAVYLSFQDKNLGLLNVVIIFAGFCSRVILGFSPTVWLSGMRTMLFFFFSVMISSTFLYVELERISAPAKLFKLIHFIVRFLAVSALVYFFYNQWIIQLYS